MSRTDIPTFRLAICAHCNYPIAEVKDPHSGARDWYSHGGDFGCDQSPDSTDEACGSHEPLGFPRGSPALAAQIRAVLKEPAAQRPDPADPFSLPEGI